jgi:hypothetical protein
MHQIVSKAATRTFREPRPSLDGASVLVTGGT